MIPIFETNTFLKEGKPFKVGKRTFKADLFSGKVAQIALYLVNVTLEGNLELLEFRGRWSSLQSEDCILQKISDLKIEKDFDIDVYITLALDPTDIAHLATGELRDDKMAVEIKDTKKVKKFVAKCSVKEPAVEQWFKQVFRDDADIIFTRLRKNS